MESKAVFEKEDDLFHFHEKSHILVTSNKPLKHEVVSGIPFVDIPDLHPVKHTVTLDRDHFYTDGSKYRKYILT